MTPSALAPAVVRAARVLDALGGGDALTASALARLLGLRLSSVADLCQTLMDEGMIRKRGDGAFVLGGRVEQWGEAIVRHPQVFRLFNSALASRRTLDGLTVTLEVMQGAEVLCLASRLGALPLPSTPRPGMRADVLESGAGRAVLRATPPHELERLFAAYAGHQGVAPELAAQYPRAARADSGEVFITRDGTHQVAAPVPPIRGEAAFAAVVLHLPSSFLEKRPAAASVKGAIGALAARLAGGSHEND